MRPHSCGHTWSTLTAEDASRSVFPQKGSSSTFLLEQTSRSGPGKHVSGVLDDAPVIDMGVAGAPVAAVPAAVVSSGVPGCVVSTAWCGTVVPAEVSAVGHAFPHIRGQMLSTLVADASSRRRLSQYGSSCARLDAHTSRSGPLKHTCVVGATVVVSDLTVVRVSGTEVAAMRVAIAVIVALGTQ